MNKKFISILLCLLFLFSFAFACDNSQESGGSGNGGGDLAGMQKDQVYDLGLDPESAPGKVNNSLSLYSDYYNTANQYSFFADKYTNTPFYSDSNDYITYLCNALWDIFGTNSQIDKNVTDRVNRGDRVIDRPLGINSAWLGIDAYKSSWYSGTLKLQSKAVLKKWPQRPDGYLWAWDDSETWAGPGYSEGTLGFQPAYHFDQHFEWINGVAEVCLWEGDTSFLDEIDETSNNGEITPPAEGQHGITGKNTYIYSDNSQGKTVRQKLESAVEYIMRSDGYVDMDSVSDNEEVYHGMGAGINGDKYQLPKFPNDNRFKKYISTNTSIKPALCLGAEGSGSSNIWDDIPFGPYSPYECALYLRSLQSLIDIYTLDGNAEKVAMYKKALADCTEAYDEMYWDANVGRYITNVSWVNDKYVNIDIGAPYVGYMAFFGGAGDEEKAKTFFDWIDGDRIIQQDRDKGGVSGETIVNRYKFATMTNTVPLESTYTYFDSSATYDTSKNVFENQLANSDKYVWWHAPGGLKIGKRSSARSDGYMYEEGAFGRFFENGGAIFYTTFYENMARIKYGFEDEALKRLTDVAGEYNVDGLDRDYVRIVEGGEYDFENQVLSSMKVDGKPIGYADYGLINWIGCAGEYPENGLVPLVYLRGFMGVNPKGDGLYIEPSIPTGYGDMGCKQVEYRNNVLNIHIYKDDCILITPNTSGKAMSVNVSDFVSGDGTYYANVDGEIIPLTENGANFKLELPNGFKRVKIYKV